MLLTSSFNPYEEAAMPVSLADESENEKLFGFYAEFDISGQYYHAVKKKC